MFEALIEDVKEQFRKGTAFTHLILTCLAVFLLSETLHLILWAGGHEALYAHLFYLLALPSSPAVLLSQPWSAFTFMFMHADVWHIFYNMLWLYWFGDIYYLYMRDRRAIAVFIAGSLAGGALVMVLSQLLPVLQAHASSTFTVGASAGIFAIVFAATALHPDHMISIFLFHIPIKWVALASFLISYVAITQGNAGGEIAHLGGAVFGFLHIKSLQSGIDWFSPLEGLQHLFRPKTKLKATYVNKKTKSDGPSAEEQRKLDGVLDKISKSGYNSLSKEEKDFLFKFSKRED